MKRLAAACAFVFAVHGGVLAQGSQDSPGQEGPPSQQATPPPQDLPPRPAQPPPRADAPAGPGERCGAVAYTADGAFGAAYGMENCDDAERLAVEECRRESTEKDDCSRGVLVRRSTWFYIQFCRKDEAWTTHVTTKQSLIEVNNSAADWARKSRYGAENCRLVPNGLLHSGGLHTKM